MIDRFYRFSKMLMIVPMATVFWALGVMQIVILFFAIPTLLQGPVAVQQYFVGLLVVVLLFGMSGGWLWFGNNVLPD